MAQHELPELPYTKNALEPYISEETLDYHYGRHHATYVKKLNNLIAGTKFESMQLEDIIRESTGNIFNNAAQVWNHSFYWKCLSPDGGGEPKGELASTIEQSYKSYTEFKKQFSEAAVGNFGSGWTWLVKNADGRLEIINTSNAETPITDGKQPLLTCDVWEHAYYIDYRNARPSYLEAFWNIVNWDFAAQNAQHK